jgi:hypothetical protein
VLDGVLDAVSAAFRPEKVTKFGFTIIDSLFNGISNTVNATAYFSGGGSEAITHTIPLAGNTADTFFGFAAPPGQFITEITLTGTNNTAGEDFAFITAVVPEPGAGVLAMSALASLVGAHHWRRVKPCRGK